MKYIRTPTDKKFRMLVLIFFHYLVHYGFNIISYRYNILFATNMCTAHV